MYSEKYLKIKIKCYDGKINTNFQNNSVPKKGSHFACLSVIWIVSGLKMSKSYYLKVFSEECKHVVKENWR